MSKTTGILVACVAAIMLPMTQGDVLAADNSKIAFASDRDGDREIYVMDADGSSQTRLTFSPGDDWGPAWSPDGTRIAYSSERDGNQEIYVMEADGSNQIRLTFNGVNWDRNPDWSPDGGKIAFESSRDGHREIYVMAPDGSNQTRLTFGTRATQAEYPRWSPDGSLIAFHKGFDTTREVWVMAPDGSSQTRITYTSGAANTGAVWSPDGSQFVFQTQRHGRYTPQIYVMNTDGSNQTRLTNNAYADGAPCWSPDGSQIAFVRGESYWDRDHDIYVMNADGSNQTPLTFNDAYDLSPHWLLSSFTAALEMTSAIVTFERAHDLDCDDSFALAGDLVLSQSSDNIDLLNEDLTVRVGTVTLTIPRGSFVPDGLAYVYKGEIDGAQIRASFSEVGVKSWAFGLEAALVDLSDTSNPVSCSLAIGNDWGEVTEMLEGQLHLNKQTLIGIRNRESADPSGGETLTSPPHRLR